MTSGKLVREYEYEGTTVSGGYFEIDVFEFSDGRRRVVKAVSMPTMSEAYNALEQLGYKRAD